MKNILVATDLSPHADRAIDRALLLARKFGATLHIIHVMQDIYHPEDNKHATQNQEAKNILTRALKTLDGWDTIKSNIHVSEGKAYDEIMAYADRVKPDLIVMGLHNKTQADLRDLFVGTTIERVMRNGTYPVLMAVKKPTSDYNHVLISTDFSDPALKSAKMAGDIIPDASFEFLHIFDAPFSGFIRDERAVQEKQQEQERAMEEFIAALPYGKQDSKIKKTMRKGTVYAELTRAINEKNPDLVVIGTQGKSSVGQALLGSTAKNILADPVTDILVTRGG